MRRILLSFIFLAITVYFCQAQNVAFWGVTFSGDGLASDGVIFNFNTTNDSLGAPCKFYAQGEFPVGSLIYGGQGILYGMVSETLSNNQGGIYCFNIVTGTDSVLHTFYGNDGSFPRGSLIQINDSSILGMTGEGGTYGGGVIFKYSILTGDYSVLHDFGNDADGSHPDGSLINAGNSLLYGLTEAGGAGDEGTIFSYNVITGSYNLLYSFSDSVEGPKPTGSLTLIADSLLFGLTNQGGPLGFGTIFSYNVNSGVLTDLHDFIDSDGSNPSGKLLSTSDGWLHGICTNGGLRNEGTIFRYNYANNVFLVEHNFGIGSNDGMRPVGSLIQGNDGLLYGTTTAGGENNDGTIFYFSTTALTERVIQSFNGSNGADPIGALLELSDSATGIFNVSPERQLEIYPNPTVGRFTIQLPGGQNNYLVDVYNMLGQKIEQLTLTNIQNTINLSNTPAGVYFVDMQTENGRVGAKVVVER